jgi:hypothetical protein
MTPLGRLREARLEFEEGILWLVGVFLWLFFVEPSLQGVIVRCPDAREGVVAQDWDVSYVGGVSVGVEGVESAVEQLTSSSCSSSSPVSSPSPSPSPSDSSSRKTFRRSCLHRHTQPH